MPVYQYRITVDMLEPPTGEEGLQSLSFFASTPDDIFAAALSLRERLDCSASRATALVVGLSLVNQASALQPAHASFLPIVLLIEA